MQSLHHKKFSTNSGLIFFEKKTFVKFLINFQI